MKLRTWIALVVLGLISATPSYAQKVPVGAAAFDDPVPAKATIAAQAKQLYAEAMKAMPAGARADVEKDLAQLDTLEPARASALAQGRAASAALFKARTVDTAYAAYAVTRAPDDAMAVGNLGAVLIDSPAVAIPLLRYANALLPKHPVILTNLGSVALDVNAGARARKFFEEALAVDREHKGALIGMAYYYMRLPDHRMALEYFYRANGVTYDRKYVEKQNDAGGGKVKPPPAPIEAKGTKWGQPVDPEAGSAHVTSYKIELPPVPNWSGPQAFASSFEARGEVRSWYGKVAGEPLKKALQSVEAALKPGGLAATTTNTGSSGRVRDPWMTVYSDNDAAIQHMLELNEAWANKKVDEAHAAFKAAMDGPYMKYANNLTEAQKDFGAAYESCLKTKGAAAIVECRGLMIAHCKRARPIRLKMFATWRDAYRQWDSTTRPVLEELYRVQAGWIRQLEDKKTWELANLRRDAAVFTPHATMAMQEEMMLLAFAGTASATFGSLETCPEEPPPPEPEPTPPGKIPGKSSPDQMACPFRDKAGNDKPLEVGVGPVSFSLDCQSVEAKYSGGVVVAAKRTFGRERSTTVFLGVGGQLKGEVGPWGGGVSAEIGMTCTVGDDGQLKNWGGGSKVSGEMNMGHFKAGAEVSGMIERGPKSTKMTFGYSAKGGFGGEHTSGTATSGANSESLEIPR